jgi:DNA polymerase-1
MTNLFVTKLRGLGFQRVIACDTEFNFGVDGDGKPLDGNPLRPVCLCAKDFISGQTWEVWLDGSTRRYRQPPFPIDKSTLLVAYNASAEIRTFKALGWQDPVRVLDLFAEFCDLRNGRDGGFGQPKPRRGLLDALQYFGLNSIGTVHKHQMIDRILKGGPFTAKERREILDYCWTDVHALERLLPAMLDGVDWKGALFRGRYAAAVASMEIAGIPINDKLLNDVVSRWSEIQVGLIRRIDRDYGVYDGTSFKKDKFEAYVERCGIPWTRLKSGALALDADTFGDMAKIFPDVAPLAALRGSIGKMRKNDIPIGDDGRARTGIRPFASSTSRNQPSTSEFLYGASKWVRNFIQPEPGCALIYLDYSAEEVGVAAALSGDTTLQADYSNGDFYINYGISLGQLPVGSTKASAEDSHPGVRDRLKIASLATLYGMMDETMGLRIDKPRAVASAWIRKHKARYHVFWKFIQGAIDHGMRGGSLETELGWHLHPRRDPNPRSLANFPIQANAAEILRVACCLVTEAGFEVCAPVHDALLVNCRIEDLERTVSEVKALMIRASQIVLGGFAIKVGIEVTKYPDHLTDKRGTKMWAAVMEQMAIIEGDKQGAKKWAAVLDELEKLELARKAVKL